MVNTIKEVFDSKYFHGRLTREEAYNLCKEEMTNTGKPYAYIWYLFESDGRLQGTICCCNLCHHRDPWFFDVQQFEVFQTPGFLCFQYNSGYFALINHRFVERKNPHQLSELARVASLDNCNGYCCLRSLIEKIDELQIPLSQKEELKKLARGFRLTLLQKVPNELCIHN